MLKIKFFFAKCALYLGTYNSCYDSCLKFESLNYLSATLICFPIKATTQNAIALNNMVYHEHSLLFSKSKVVI